MKNKKACIVDYRMYEKVKKYIENSGYTLVENSEYHSGSYAEISYHPDIYYLVIDNAFILDKNKYKFAMNNIPKEILDKYTINIANNVVESKYPNTCILNICILGNYAIHNFDYTDSVLIKILEDKKLKKINVKQGYSNCSTVVLNANACITTDIGIYNQVIKNKIDCLYIKENNIKLVKKYSIENENEKYSYSNMNGFIRRLYICIR